MTIYFAWEWDDTPNHGSGNFFVLPATLQINLPPSNVIAAVTLSHAAAPDTFCDIVKCVDTLGHDAIPTPDPNSPEYPLVPPVFFAQDIVSVFSEVGWESRGSGIAVMSC